MLIFKHIFSIIYLSIQVLGDGDMLKVHRYNLEELPMVKPGTIGAATE